MRLSRDDREKLELIQGLLKLAAANAPRCHDVKIETCGVNPHASISLPYYVLNRAVDLALQADKEPSA